MTTSSITALPTSKPISGKVGRLSRQEAAILSLPPAHQAKLARLVLGGVEFRCVEPWGWYADNPGLMGSGGTLLALLDKLPDIAPDDGEMVVVVGVTDDRR